MQAAKAIIDMLQGSYRHVASDNYELPQSLVNVWVSCGAGFQLAYDIETDRGANGLVYWWFASGRREFRGVSDLLDRYLFTRLHLSHLPATAAAAHDMRPDGLNLDHPPDIADCDQLPLTPLLSIIWNNRRELRAVMDIDTPQGVSRLWQWWIKNGSRELLGNSAAAIDKVRIAKPQDINAANRPTTAPPQPGVSLVGYPGGEFGLGEDIRQLRASLQSIGIDPTVIVAPWTIMARQNTKETFIESDLGVFDTDIAFFVMPAFDTLTLLNKVGPTAFKARRRIGFWQWEFDLFPRQVLPTIDLVDEIWCHSEHVAKGFRQATRKPVHKVPLPVSFVEPRKVPRAKFGLPKDAFIFLTSFDGASFITRKNPLATILAFQQAFPLAQTERNVGLVVKAMNTMNDPLWRECLRKVAHDKRIIIVDSVLDHSDYYELLRNCDAVVSLHRAEGFGRLMAEAMAMGIPAIASRYSGNLDFMTDKNSWLIGGNLVPVMPGDYPFHQDQFWLEPSATEAALALRECVADDAKRRRLAAVAKSDVLSKHSPAVCGAAYLKILETPQ